VNLHLTYQMNDLQTCSPLPAIVCMQVRDSVDDMIFNCLQTKLQTVGKAVDGQEKKMDMMEKGEQRVKSGPLEKCIAQQQQEQGGTRPPTQQPASGPTLTSGRTSTGAAPATAPNNQVQASAAGGQQPSQGVQPPSTQVVWSQGHHPTQATSAQGGRQRSLAECGITKNTPAPGVDGGGGGDHSQGGPPAGKRPRIDRDAV
jgi:hypothetical protein